MATTNFSWTLPIVGGSNNAWGGILNTILTDIDDKMLSREGGSMTGNLDIHSDTHKAVDLGIISGTVDIDLDDGRFFYGTVAGATTFTISSPPSSGKVAFIMLELTNPGSNITWPASVKWPGGSPPSLTSSGVDVIAMYTRDGGATWRAALAQKDSS